MSKDLLQLRAEYLFRIRSTIEESLRSHNPDAQASDADVNEALSWLSRHLPSKPQHPIVYGDLDMSHLLER